MAQEESIDRLLPLLQQVFAEEDGLRRFLEAAAEQAMSAEVRGHLNAGHHQRTEARTGYRNGSKPRQFKTRVGELELFVPQVRGCEPYHPGLFGRWQRSERALLAACAEMYFQGVSTRNVRQVLGIFPNRAACDRLIGAQLLEVHEQWQTDRAAYFNTEQYAGV